MAQILIHPTATGPAAIARLEAETGRVAVLAGMAAELIFGDGMSCDCAARHFDHDIDECCGCEDAPECAHWIASVDPFGTGDYWHTEYERAPR